MELLRKNARIAGFFYIGVILIAPIRLIFIPNALFSTGNAETLRNIATHAALFRFGIFADLWTAVLNVCLVLALYRLLNGVNRNLAALMVIFGLLQVPIYFMNTLNDVGSLLFAQGVNGLATIAEPQKAAIVTFFIALHHYGVLVNEVFWGLWLLPFGILVYRSGFLPRFLGIWLVLNCLAYLAASTAGILFPGYADTVANIAFPIQFGEIATALWLAVMGISMTQSRRLAQRVE